MGDKKEDASDRSFWFLRFILPHGVSSHVPTLVKISLAVADKKVFETGYTHTHTHTHTQTDGQSCFDIRINKSATRCSDYDAKEYTKVVLVLDIIS